MSRTDKVPALKLNLGGAPATWHTVQDLPGFYHPEIPTPVGGPGECDLETAKAAAKREGTPVELVELTPAQVEKSRDALREQHAAARGIVRGDLSTASRQQLDNELDALAAGGVAALSQLQAADDTAAAADQSEEG